MVEKKTEKEEKKPDRIKAEELEEIIVKLAQEGNSPAKIGLILKEKHKVPKSKSLGKKIARVLRAKNIEVSDEIKDIENKIKKIEEHISKNQQDKRAKRELVTNLAKLKKLKKYRDRKAGK